MIRPIDLQTTLFQAAQSAPAVQRAEDAPRLAAQAAQAAFAAELSRRDESVAATTEVLGNRIGAKPEGSKGRGSDGRKQQARTPAEEVVVAEATADIDDAPHRIDITA